MGLFNNERVYCQTCGEEITSHGAYVSEKGTFCPNKNARCIEKFVRQHGDIYFDYLNSKEIQEGIKKGNLKNYKKIESGKQLEYLLGEIKENFGDFPRQYSTKEKKGYVCKGGYPPYIEGDGLYLKRIKDFLYQKRLEKLAQK